MMTWCEAGAVMLDQASKTLFVQCKGAPVDEGGEAPDYGKAPMMCALGLFVFPYPANENGAAELLVEDSIVGLDGAVVGARDARMSDVVGKGKPGDAILSTVGPQHAACIHLKEEERQVAQITRDSQGRTMMALLDGKNDKVQITALGAHIEIDPQGNIRLTSASGNGLIIDESGVHAIGKLTCGLGVPGLSVALCTPAGYPLGGIVASQVAFFG